MGVIVIGQLTGLNENYTWPDSNYYYKAAHASPGVCWTLHVSGMIMKVSAAVGRVNLSKKNCLTITSV
jgi:hypothetical protein